MSNVKSFAIVVDLPFNYMENFSDEDAMLWGRLFLSPSVGIKLDFGSSRMIANKDGGQTAIYSATITGHEAIPWPMVDRIERILKLHAFKVIGFQVVDIEA